MDSRGKCKNEEMRMAYSEKARTLRLCKAMWGNPNQLCSAHAGRTRGPSRPGGAFYERRTIAVCTCAAYTFPHRPGGGLCRWPEPPIFRSTIKPGTRGVFSGLFSSLRDKNEVRRVIRVTTGNYDE